MTDSIDVTYHGDLRRQQQIDPFRYPGLPDLPLGVPVEITEEYLNTEFCKYGVLDWGTFLFDPEHGFFNEGLPSPLITMAVNRESPFQIAATAFQQLANAPAETPPPSEPPPNDNAPGVDAPAEEPAP